MLNRLTSLPVTCILLLGGCAGLERTDSPSAPPRGSVEEPDAHAAASPDLEAREIERALHHAVNRARRNHGRAPLSWRDSLSLLAHRHSQDMAQRSFFSHVSPDGTGPAARAERLGLPVTRRLDEGHTLGIGENLFRVTHYTGYRDRYVRDGDGPRRHVERTYQWRSSEKIVREAVRSWLDSPPHRRTLLSRDYEQHGLGIAVEGKWIYVTQNLF